jgi:hypothetical protein
MHGAHPTLDSTGVADPGCLSRIRIFSIPDPRIRIIEFKYLNPNKWFINSRIYDPGPSSRIRIFYPIPDPGCRGQKGTGSWIRNTGFYAACPPYGQNYVLRFFLPLSFPALSMCGAHPASYSTSVADPGSLSGSRIRIFSIIKEFKCFNPKKWFLNSENMIRVVHPVSGSRILIFTHSGCMDLKVTGSRIRNTGFYAAWPLYDQNYLCTQILVTFEFPFSRYALPSAWP